VSHARHQIREQMAIALTGLTTTGTTVYRSRVYPHDTLPSLACYALHERIDDDMLTQGSKEVRLLEMMIEGRARAVTDLDDTLDQIAAEVEAVIYADTTLDGLVKDMRLEETTIELSDEAQQPTGLLRLRVSAFYRIDAQDPETVLA